MDRRDFLKGLGVAAGSALAGRELGAAETKEDGDKVGVLVDTTACVGCRTCEEACAEANGLPVPDIDNDEDLEQWRDTSDHQWSVINRYEVDGEEVFAKRQCMHCDQPACASACLTTAMTKTSGGPVVWREDKCIGCRYCVLSCPFGIPKFEYEKAVPKVQKCILCFDEVKEGGVPACVDNCPEEALTFGRRAELLEIAKTRIYQNPDRYVHHVYGEREVGGTSWMYLSAVPFEKLNFRTDLGETPMPEYTKDFLYAVPVFFALGPAFLLGLSRATRHDGAGEPEE